MDVYILLQANFAESLYFFAKTEKGDIAKENEVNDFILRPKEGPTMKERFKGELEGQTISYLVFDQEGPPTTRSRFFSIEPYNMLEISGDELICFNKYLS